MASISKQFKISEMYEHNGIESFSGTPMNGGGWCLSWVQRRGRMAADSTDGGSDLYLYSKHSDPSRDDFPEAVITSVSSLSRAVWQTTEQPLTDPQFIVTADQQLLTGSAHGLSPSCWVQLPPESHFGYGAPVWCAAGALFVVEDCSGSSLWLAVASERPLELDDCHRLWRVGRGQNILSFDGSLDGGSIVLVQQMVEGFIGEVMLLDITNKDSPQSRRIAVDGRVDYCTPQVAFTGDGKVLCRLNLAADDTPVPGENGRYAVTTGLWLIDHEHDITQPVLVMPDMEHGSYDVKSGSACDSGGNFVLNASRTVAAVSARSHSYQTTADRLYLVGLDSPQVDQAGSLVPGVTIDGTTTSKGCYTAVALHGDLENSTVLFNFCNPVELGDLYSVTMAEEQSGRRLTRTMPRSLARKFIEPEEHVITCPDKGTQCHAMIYRPDASGPKSQPILWLHSGPLTHAAFEPHTVCSWLCRQGYVVCALNFRGSTGFGMAHMDAIFGNAGRADLADCVTAAAYLKQLGADPSYNMDLSRGVGVTGFSWGGYLTLMCMVATEPGTFGCGE